VRKKSTTQARKRRASPARRVKRVATEVVAQAVDAGKAAMSGARALGERMGEATSSLVDRVT
jgi:hypothetical protein